MMADTEQHEAPSGAGAATRPLPCPGGGGQMAAFLIVAVMVGAFFRLMAPNIPDPDSFYHFRHAAIYAEKGITYSQFPWLVYSVVNRLSADLGYGFHLLLVPLTFLGDQVLGVKLGAVLETVITLTLLFLVLRRHRIAFCGVWPFAVFLLGPPMTYTFLMTRPQTLTMGLCALLFSLLVRGPAWGVLLAAAAICFFHLNVFVIVPVIVAIVALCKCLTGGGWEWRKWVAAAAGMGLGALLRPNPLGAVKLEYVQFLVHEMVRKEGIPLNFGREWLPVNLEGLVAGFSWFLLLWAIMLGTALAIAARGGREDREGGCLLWSSLALSILFFVVMVTFTKRVAPLWAVFSVIFAAQTFSRLVRRSAVGGRHVLSGETRLVVACVVGVLLVAMAGAVLNEHIVREKWRAHNSYRMRDAAFWLADHSQPGDIVLNVSWSSFPELFFWNTKNRYVHGLDPIFLFAYDQKLYWKVAALDGRPVVQSAAAKALGPELADMDLYELAKTELGASYVLVEARRRSPVEAQLSGDMRFERVFDDRDVVIFAVE